MTRRKVDSFRPLRVLASTRVAARMQRLRFEGSDLAHFETMENLHARLHVPDRSIAGDQTAVRYYTIRRIDAAANWLEIDFVLHGDFGPGSHFALHAKPGDMCGISGPCGLGIKKADRYLLVGDLTALSAIARISESLPEVAAGVIALYIDQIDDRMAFRVPLGMNLVWIHRSYGGGIDESSFEKTELSRAVNEAAAADKGFVWTAGEESLVRNVRSALASFKKSRMLCVPYWRQMSLAPDHSASLNSFKSLVLE